MSTRYGFQKWQSLNRYAHIGDSRVSHSIVCTLCFSFSYIISVLIEEMFLWLTISFRTIFINDVLQKRNLLILGKNRKCQQFCNLKNRIISYLKQQDNKKVDGPFYSTIFLSNFTGRRAVSKIFNSASQYLRIILVLIIFFEAFLNRIKVLDKFVSCTWGNGARSWIITFSFV